MKNFKPFFGLALCTAVALFLANKDINFFPTINEYTKTSQLVNLLFTLSLMIIYIVGFCLISFSKYKK
jgi:hypothetical protein